MKGVDIIIVNWNSGASTLKAIEPYLPDNCGLGVNIIVVDNASLDDSVALLQNRVDNLIVNEKNMGFAKACNQAYPLCKSEYLLLLNPDTESSIATLQNLIKFLDVNPDYGITGPQQILANGEIAHTCCRFPTFYSALLEVTGLSKAFPKLFTPAPHMTDWNHRTSRDVDHVIGSYYLIRRSIIEGSGFMDERFFLYFEDLDFSKRVADAGYKCFYSAENKIKHISGGTGKFVTRDRLFYSFLSRRKYWQKHFGKTESLLLTLLGITVEPPLRIIHAISVYGLKSAREVCKAYLLFVSRIVGKNE